MDGWFRPSEFETSLLAHCCVFPPSLCDRSWVFTPSSLVAQPSVCLAVAVKCPWNSYHVVVVFVVVMMSSVSRLPVLARVAPVFGGSDHKFVGARCRPAKSLFAHEVSCFDVASPKTSPSKCSPINKSRRCASTHRENFSCGVLAYLPELMWFMKKEV